MRRWIGSFLALAALATAASACISDPAEQAPPAVAVVPASVPATTPADDRSSPIPAEATELPGLQTLLYQEPTQGPSIVGRARVRPGVPLWAIVTCHAAAGTEIEVELKPLDHFTVSCSSTGDATSNQIDLTEGAELTVQVSSPGDATWSLRLQQ
ncbi:hypothetical protein AB0J74_20785 [Asanoa sp. NPDC049573]|uniref:hypothetical protein n=1 Tax=Asanoa sp. NPDC049573 TaxID=3155396 RepID=UPI003446D8C4